MKGTLPPGSVPFCVRGAIAALLRTRMPAFFVHGVPDTHRLWDKVRSHLSRRDVIAPSLPGFSAPLPEGFRPVKESYVDWLVAEIERVGEPVDLVGHDWGCFFALRVASLRPDLVRTLACGNGGLDREYVWHDIAQQWQTPEIGEAFMAAVGHDEAVEGSVASGNPREDALVSAAHMDDTMKRCILELYRSAVHVGDEWQDGLAAINMPTLVLWAKDDPFVEPRFGERLAAHTRGELVFLENCGHHWPLQKPAEVAAALESFWSRHARKP
jgi:pimeloyl-ACP methyl ester carboxylesterase